MGKDSEWCFMNMDALLRIRATTLSGHALKQHAIWLIIADCVDNILINMTFVRENTN